MFEEIKSFLLNQYTIGNYLNEYHKMIELNDYLITLVDENYNVHTFCFQFSYSNPLAECSYYRIIGTRGVRIVQQFQVSSPKCLNLYKEIERLVKARNNHEE